MKNIVELLTGTAKEYITLDLANFNKAHGNGLSVKIVVPCFCQARCPFCFNNLTTETQRHDFNKFFADLKISLDRIFDTLGESRTISLDITGNEPTFNVTVFNELMYVLKDYRDRADKIVLTSNGFHLYDCLPAMAGIVDIVNVSLHHYDENVRKTEILRTQYIPDNFELKKIVTAGNSLGITFTAVAVLFKKFERFETFFNKFVAFAKETGFKDVRFRSNFVDRTDYQVEVENAEIEYIHHDQVPGLDTKIIKVDGFEVRILAGVPDLTEFVIGPELVIDDDGETYLDYNKRFKINETNIEYMKNVYLFA